MNFWFSIYFNWSRLFIGIHCLTHFLVKSFYSMRTGLARHDFESHFCGSLFSGKLSQNNTDRKRSELKMEVISCSQFAYRVLVIISASGICALLLFAFIEVFKITNLVRLSYQNLDNRREEWWWVEHNDEDSGRNEIVQWRWLYWMVFRRSEHFLKIRKILFLWFLHSNRNYDSYISGRTFLDEFSLLVEVVVTGLVPEIIKLRDRALWPRIVCRDWKAKSCGFCFSSISWL